MPQIGPKLQYNGGTFRRKTTIPRGASCKFVSRRKCILRRLLAILRFAHDRLMLQIGPNLRSCGGESWSRTHAAANRECDDSACHRAALWLPDHGVAGGRPFFPDICGLWRRTNTHGRSLAPHGGLEGGLFSPEMRRLCRRPWPEHACYTCFVQATHRCQKEREGRSHAAQRAANRGNAVGSDPGSS